jgi:hypothetical protein
MSELPVEIPSGDIGIGLCYGCIKTLVLELRDGKPPGKRTRPRWAVTMAPGPFNPPGAPAGVFELVAVPSCLECLGLSRPGDGPPRPPQPQPPGRPYAVAAADGTLIRPGP